MQEDAWRSYNWKLKDPGRSYNWKLKDPGLSYNWMLKDPGRSYNWMLNGSLGDGMGLLISERERKRGRGKKSEKIHIGWWGFLRILASFGWLSGASRASPSRGRPVAPYRNQISSFFWAPALPAWRAGARFGFACGPRARVRRRRPRR